MNKTIAWIIILGFFGAALAFGDVSTATAPSPDSSIADWAFLQSVGGLQVGQALQQTGNSWKLPLYCDLSGQQTFTQTPTLVNSGMLITKTQVQQEGRNIFISLHIEKPVWTSNPKRAQCPVVVVDSTVGVHEVLYRDGAGKTTHLSFAEFKIDSPANK